MTAILNLTGQVLRAGTFFFSNDSEFFGQTRVEIAPMGRSHITIIGLTRDEAIAFAKFLYRDPVRLTCESET